MDNEAVSDADDEEQPKQVERLKGAEQSERDDEGEAALVLLSLPVELVRADGLELGEQTPNDAQVEVVAQVDPHTHEGEVVGAGERVVEVVESLGCLEIGRVSKRAMPRLTGAGQGLTAKKKSLMSWVM